MSTAGDPPPDDPGFAPIGADAHPPPPPPAPPPTGARANLPPPPGYGYGYHAPPSPSPLQYAPVEPTRRSPWIRIAVGAGAVAVIALRIGFRLLADNWVEDDRDRSPDRFVDDRAIFTELDEGPFAFPVGQCFVDVQVPAPAMEPVDCAVAHDGEVYALVEHPAPLDQSYPGDAALVELARSQCVAGFQPFVGTPYESSSLDYRYVYPDEAAWFFNDERTIVCAVIAVDGTQRTGTAAGSGL